MIDEWNARAREFMESRAFACETEPEWVVGRVPDFYCKGPEELWLEVKSLRPPTDEVRLFRILDDLEERAENVEGYGSADAYVSRGASERDTKAVIGLVSRTLGQSQTRCTGELLCVVPNDPDYTRQIDFTFLSEEGPIHCVSCRSTSGIYGFPYGLVPSPWLQTVLVNERSKPTTDHTLYKFAGEGQFRIALRILPSAERFHIGSGTRSEGMVESLTCKHIRNAMSDANDQLKNGQRHRPASGAVFIFQDRIGAANDLTFWSDLFGDRTYTFDSKNFNNGKWGYGDNANWQVSKHTSTSVAGYFRHNATPIFVHNPWAKSPLPPGVFGGVEYLPTDDGTFRRVDNTE